MILNKQQLKSKVDFVNNYLAAINPAAGSKYDANANVESKNVATLMAELNKDMFIQTKRQLVSNKISELFGTELADEYNRQINEHEIYVHDESSLAPYCVSISMYPLLLEGLKTLGGESSAPTHLDSFCGSFVNLMFAISSQFSGAVAATEMLMYFDHFARLDYGDDYLTTHKGKIENHLQHIIYAVNQPAAARAYQSVFWNISIFDSYYFESLFGNFVFPDGDIPKYESLDKLQRFFMAWFNKERTKALLTFPVITAAMLSNEDKTSPRDEKFADFVAGELAEGNSFFIYTSDNADSLASCCRLRNSISTTEFSYSLGAGGVSTGSINVITLNMNRLTQKNKDLAEQVKKIHKYQVATRAIFEEWVENDFLPVYKAGYISLKKQFSTIGINGMVEAAEFSGVTPGNNPEYIRWVSERLKIIYDLNREASKEYGCMFNTEFVPAENLGVKHAKWDREDGLVVPRDCYNSYFYPVEEESINMVDKFELHGSEMVQWLDGGSALHLNLEQYPTKEQYKKILDIAISKGTNYFCTNVRITICNNCGHINKNTEHHCTKCGSKNVVYGTRVIGYLKKVSSFSLQRQEEHDRRVYHS